MPHHHLVWDFTKKGDRIILEIDPDAQVSVNGSLRVMRNHVQSPEQLLTAKDLVPGWSHKLADHESIHLTLTFGFASENDVSVRVKARCEHPDGTLHQGPPYAETYTGKGLATTDVFVWAS